jgi:hypothetical protein
MLDFEANVMNEYGHSNYTAIATESAGFADYNPFMFVYNWIKMELLDIKAMLECFQRLEDFQTSLAKKESQLLQQSSDLEKLQSIQQKQEEIVGLI